MSNWFERYGYAPVHPHLWVGAVPLDARDVDALARTGIGRVMNLVEDGEYPDGARFEVEIAYAENDIEEARLALVDFGHLAPDALSAATAQVERWLTGGHRVYLHCRAGWQRSASVAAALIADREGVGIETALERLRGRKPTADPLPHQREDLIAWWNTRGQAA